ncbi:MAG: right-handed parallel beta-helix repeat-containing protein [Saprospiraceae bacterium]|nr:right-handed parallel beta-helix repeat-containing protein [Saprospiraceae bacterium]
MIVNGKSFNGISSGATLSLTHGVDFTDDPSTIQLTSITATNAGLHNCTTTGSPIHSIAGPTVNNIDPGTISPAVLAVCNGTGTTINSSIAATVDDAAPTYSWEVSQDMAFGSYSNYNTPFYNTPNLNTGNLVNNTNAPISYYFRRRATSIVNGVTCSQVTPIVSVLVNPTPTVDDPANLVRCNGESASVSFTSVFNVAGTSFSWTNDQPSIGLAASGTGNIASFTTTNNTNVPVVATITVTPSANSCDGLPETFTITVNPEPVMDPAVPTTKTINSYDAVAINFATAGSSVAAASYTLVSITPQVGLVAGMGNATIGTGQSASAIAADTWVNESGGPLTVTYVVKPVSADNCEGDAYNIVVTVNFLPVHNVTQNTYYQTIQAGIAAGNPRDVLEWAEWTFNERVVVDKPLTIQGVSKVNTIITGTGLAGTGSGMTLNNGVANVTIKDLTVQNLLKSGPNGSAGSYAVSGNDNLTIDNTIIKDNLGGSGFYANGPISNVLIDDNTVSGHTNVAGAAWGIVIWNGLKQNITITNNEVFGNNCCGIELQDGSATGVTITGNNVHDNADNGIGVVGLMGPGANTVSGNTVTGQRPLRHRDKEPERQWHEQRCGQHPGEQQHREPDSTDWCRGAGHRRYCSLQARCDCAKRGRAIRCVRQQQHRFWLHPAEYQ